MEEKQTQKTSPETTKAKPEEEPKVPEQSEREKEAQKELEAAQRELAEEKERFLRLAAEYDNYKKRTAKEKEELYLAAASGVLQKLLPVFDNLERAESCKDYSSLRDGVKLILDSFHSALNACGVKEIEALGAPFDPALHEAVSQEKRDDCPENSVCEVLQKGYLAGDRVLRHAMVKVANS